METASELHRLFALPVAHDFSVTQILQTGCEMSCFTGQRKLEEREVEHFINHNLRGFRRERRHFIYVRVYLVLWSRWDCLTLELFEIRCH